MNRRLAWRVLFGGFCGMFLAADIFAQSEKPALASLKPGTSWKVEVSEGRGRKFRLIEENVVGKDFRQNVLSFSDGSTLTRYVVGRLMVYRAAGAPGFSVEAIGPEAFGGPVAYRPLVEFAWVEPKFFVKEETVDGVRCRIYQRSSSGKEASQGAGEPFETASISVETRLPLRLENPSEIRRYSFKFDTPIEFPADVQAALKRREEIITQEKKFYKVPQ